MWTQTIVRLLAVSFVGGVLCGAVWDLLKISRMIFGISEAQSKKAVHIAVIFVQDVTFCIICACVTLVALYYGNEGEMRGIALGGEACGFFVYRATLGAFIFAVISRCIELCRKIFDRVKKRWERLPKVKISKRNKIGKHQNCKVVGDKRMRKAAFHKSEPRASRQRKKSA